MDKDFLQILRCPITNDSLVEVEATLLDQAIAAQATGALRDRQDREVEAFSGGLTDSQNRWFYPTRSSIPNLIPDQAISVERILAAASRSSSGDPPAETGEVDATDDNVAETSEDSD